ncbi:hypothetical protein D9619_004282 [Psilocybe cf. subviscida]|uniref:Uncharacterized protein n=1 Tax=Psilocybe cf. subviscida TaxID=2480587 RepID=A0A8H5F8X7_9AGAR|nr:hypothetical protein D9619_004282 [Psilocybe cf. subviscida]
MAACQYSSFEDFQSKSGINFPHGEDRTTRRYGTYIEPFLPREEPNTPRIYDRSLRRESDGVWEYMTPMGSGTERPASQRSHSSGVPTSCIPSFVKNRRDCATGPHNGVPGIHSHVSTPSPPPPYTSCESWTASSAAHGKPFNLLGLPKKDLEPELTRALKEAQDVVQHQLHLVNTDGSVACPRAGCRHVVEDVNALTRHLHIHLVAESVFCPRCKARFEHSRELDTHKCRKRGLSASAPIEALRRVFHIKSPHV